MDFLLIAVLVSIAVAIIGHALVIAKVGSLASRRPAARTGSERQEDGPALMVSVQNRLGRIEASIGELTSAIERQQAVMKASSAQSDLARGGGQPSSTEPIRSIPAQSLPEQAAPQTSAGGRGPASPPVPTERKAILVDDVMQQGSSEDPTEDLLSEYRALLANPVKSEINRWADANGGSPCEALDDGSFQISTREAGSMLILIPIGEHDAIVLPGGRLVAEFAISFANSFALRAVTNRAYDLVSDGSGVLKLPDPAIAKWRDGNWMLEKTGRISGLTSD